MIALALVAVGLAGGSGLLALPFRSPGRSDHVANAVLCLGAALGVAASAWCLATDVERVSVPWSPSNGLVSFRLDAIAAMFLIQLFVIAAAGSVYGLGYWAGVDHRQDARKLRVFYGLMVAGMGLVFLAADAAVFFTGWEVMAIAAFMALTTEDRDERVREAGRLYVYCTKAATLALMAMFAVWYGATGTLALGPITTAPPLLFALALLGFGFKAGAMPLHVWLPSAHGSAPSHVSALMSGVLIKTGIYGLVRILGWCSGVPAWWGQVVFAVGVVSAVLGVVIAIGQHDVKRLLAYHSIENIGIILIGLGMALVGRSIGAQDLVVLGLAGALLHTWNHGLFKALLFLSAGAVIHGTGVRDIDRLGGLLRRMPWTGLAFLAGAVAICGLPPLNGFVSEFLLYVGLLRSLGAADPGGAWLMGGLGAPALALTGALALLCFAKVFGVVFLGEPRTPEAAHAHPAGRVMLAPMGALVLLCAFIGVGPIALVPVLDAAVGAWGIPAGASVVDYAPLGVVTAMSVGLLSLLGGSAALLWWRLGRAPAADVGTWDCGYAAPGPTMQYTGSSFAEQVLGLFAWATFPVRHQDDVAPSLFPAPARFASHARDAVLDRVLMPGARLGTRGMVALQRLQRGSLHEALVYLLVALVVAFAWI